MNLRVQTDNVHTARVQRQYVWKKKPVFVAGEGGKLLTVAWPTTPLDFSQDLCTALKCKVGGSDLSEGAEAMPVQWINAIDTKRPDPFVYVSRCEHALFPCPPPVPSSRCINNLE